MPDTVFGADALHESPIRAVVQRPLSHVMLRRIVDNAVPAFALIWRMGGQQLLEICFFVFK